MGRGVGDWRITELEVLVSGLGVQVSSFAHTSGHRDRQFLFILNSAKTRALLCLEADKVTAVR